MLDRVSDFHRIGRNTRWLSRRLDANMSIATIYRVSVTVHDTVYLEFGHTPEYERKSTEATKGNLSAGENSYSEVEHWAEFSSLKEAQACEKRLMDMNYFFAAKLDDKVEVPLDPDSSVSEDDLPSDKP